jgi:heme-degrading monooxygenase HmoA
MIARLWLGRTPPPDRDPYAEYLKQTGWRDLNASRGNEGVLLLRRDLPDSAEFGVLSLWDSLESVKSFAGPRPERAVYYPEDQRYLLELPETLANYEVLAHTLG